MACLFSGSFSRCENTAVRGLPECRQNTGPGLHA